MSDNVIPLRARIVPRPQVGRWRMETVSLDKLPETIVEIAEHLQLSAMRDDESHRAFALLVLAACTNALYQEG